MTVVHLAAECWPYAQTGGLGMAVRGLARAQARADLDPVVVLPLYRRVRRAAVVLEPLGPAFEVPFGHGVEQARLWQVRGGGARPRVVFVEHDGYFDRDGIYGEGGADYPDNGRRFAFFTLAALRALPGLTPAPPLLHAHDWHAALAPVYLRAALAAEPYSHAVPAILSVHNAAFQGRFPVPGAHEFGLAAARGWRGVWDDRVNWLEAGLGAADLVVTVSPTHARELRTPLGGFGLHDAFHELEDRLVGTLNGIETDVWNPETDPYLAARYSAGDLAGKAICKTALQRAYGLTVGGATPLVAMCARLVGQKGLDLILNGAVLELPDVQFVFLGRGESRYEWALRERAAAAPHRIAVDLAFDDQREHALLAGADLLLMPSLYEPCGLTQMCAQRYGTIPVARRVGGLADTIVDGTTGFLFDEYEPAALERALQQAMARYGDPAAWAGYQRAAMARARAFGWERATEQYLGVYGRALRLRRPCRDGPPAATRTGASQRGVPEGSFA